MDCLYSTTTIYNYVEYKRFNLKLLFTPVRMIFYALVELCMLFLAWLYYDLFYIILGILFPTLIAILQPIQFKRTWKTYKAANNNSVRYDFYDTYLMVKDEYGEGKLEYNKLHKIIESKRNFYLMISKNQGYILNKQNFPEGLTDFLRNIEIQ